MLSFGGFAKTLWKNVWGEENRSNTPANSNQQNDIIGTRNEFTVIDYSIEKQNNDHISTEENKTLAELFSEFFSFLKFEALAIKIVGAQNAGKTAMILAMILHYTLNNVHFTLDMSKWIDELLITGEAMVTLKKTSRCSIVRLQ